MTIIITGNEGEFLYNIVTDGEKCSIIEQDSERILTRFGKISIKGNVQNELEQVKKGEKTAQSACRCAKESDTYA